MKHNINIWVVYWIEVDELDIITPYIEIFNEKSNAEVRKNELEKITSEQLYKIRKYQTEIVCEILIEEILI